MKRQQYNEVSFLEGQEMSWPHVLSFSRVLAAPVIAELILSRPGDAYLMAAVLFCLASITDLLDGKLARYSRRASPFGVFLDTTSDKVFVSLVLVALAVAGLCQAWIPLVIIGREFLISGLRSYAASNNCIISAHIWGKGKAALTMVAIFCLLLSADGRHGGILSTLGVQIFWDSTFSVSSWLLGLSAVLTIVSGARYIIDAIPLFRAEPELAVRGTPRAIVRDRPRGSASTGTDGL